MRTAALNLIARLFVCLATIAIAVAPSHGMQHAWICVLQQLSPAANHAHGHDSHHDHEAKAEAGLNGSADPEGGSSFSSDGHATHECCGKVTHIAKSRTATGVGSEIVAAGALPPTPHVVAVALRPEWSWGSSTTRLLGHVALLRTVIILT